ncbi:uncharacterized protein LOC127082263 [Lathyrus oleraceus]|uniref:uncharacterized protein LOC127082263 n=1 Tax=Pisum sativum TaxID=3888 RepID=UPI001FC54979|nr:uncharacterized protein LOC127082263 [Pisum sativum]
MARGLKLCLIISTVFLIIVTVVILTLILTIFKPKDPTISVGLPHFNLLSPNITMNMTLGMVITILNPNYGSFKYQNSIGYVTYHDTVVGNVPIDSQLVPARSEINVTTNADFMVGKLIQNPKFWSDIVQNGMVFNLTSTTELPGKAIVLKYVKVKAIAYCSCNISVNITSNGVESNCISRIKFF